MQTEPRDLDRDALLIALGTWELSIASLSYLPVGAGSHHYLALDSQGGRWFVTVDELLSKLFGHSGPTFSPWIDVDLDAAFEVLERSFRTAIVLRDAGLDFVHAPIRRPDGEVLARIGHYAVSVFAFIDEIVDTPAGVVTHGQVHGGNVIRTGDDRLLLVDWECVAVAPRERDLGTWGNDLDPKTDEDWRAYTASGEPSGIDPNAMELYRYIGLLWGVCNDTFIVSKAHVDNGDTRHEWNELQIALAAIGV